MRSIIFTNGLKRMTATTIYRKDGVSTANSRGLFTRFLEPCDPLWRLGYAITAVGAPAGPCRGLSPPSAACAQPEKPPRDLRRFSVRPLRASRESLRQSSADCLTLAGENGREKRRNVSEDYFYTVRSRWNQFFIQKDESEWMHGMKMLGWKRVIL